MSECPLSHKSTVVRTLANRDVKCNNNIKTFYIEEKKIIFSVLTDNDYPISWCKKICNEIVNSIISTPPPFQYEKVNGCVSIAYYKNISEKL